jgi:hypothetical protein
MWEPCHTASSVTLCHCLVQEVVSRRPWPGAGGPCASPVLRNKLSVECANLCKRTRQDGTRRDGLFFLSYFFRYDVREIH